MDIWSVISEISDKINIIIEGLDKSEEYIDKLNEERVLLEIQNKTLNQNLQRLKYINTVVLLDEFKKIKHNLRQNKNRLSIIQQEIDAIGRIIKKQNKLLDELIERKQKLLEQSNNVVVRMSDYVERFKNKNNTR